MTLLRDSVVFWALPNTKEILLYVQHEKTSLFFRPTKTNENLFTVLKMGILPFFGPTETKEILFYVRYEKTFFKEGLSRVSPQRFYLMSDGDFFLSGILHNKVGIQEEKGGEKGSKNRGSCSPAGRASSSTARSG